MSESPAVLPLSALLSQALVAFTIEFDNEAERQLAHRTTRHVATPGSHHAPWLVSLVMWSNCMRFVGEDGVAVRELERLAGARTNLNGMERWGYIVIAPDPADKRAKPPRSQWRIRATAAGRKAQEIWRPLSGVIEERWQERFGKDEIDRLRNALQMLLGQIQMPLPDGLPILEYGLFSRVPDHQRPMEDAARLHLPALLSKVLLVFALEFERESDLSLAISANVLRVLDKKGVPLRILPLLSGVSKESISMAMGILQKKRLVVVEPDKSAPRTKIARLTAQGCKAQEAYHWLVCAIEDRWKVRFGKDAVGALRQPLERLPCGPLLSGLKPCPGGWRAALRQPETLPHYPMVLHRGGFPDGS